MSNLEMPTNVTLLFRYLADLDGFVVSEPDRSGSFDQIFQLAKSDGISVRFVRDRGDEFLQIRHSDEWFSTDLVRFLLSGEQPADERIDIQNEASFLKSHFEEIERLFRSENRDATILLLHELRQKKIRCMFPDTRVGGLKGADGAGR